MKRKLLLTLGVVWVGLWVPGPSPGMAIQDFAKMNDSDDATYVTAMVMGVAKWLRSQGHPDQAQKTIDLFKDATKRGGLNQLVVTMKLMNGQNNFNSINPNNRAHPLEVEDAMVRTLGDNGITVPLSYLKTVNKDFQPAGPPRPKVILTPSRDVP
jgi:hypothetical protein